MAAGTRIVIVQVRYLVKEQQAADLDQFRIQLPAKPILEPLLDGTSKSLPCERRGELIIEVIRRRRLAGLVRAIATAEKD